jgi:hypothetical protein
MHAGGIVGIVRMGCWSSSLWYVVRMAILNGQLLMILKFIEWVVGEIMLGLTKF